MCEFTTGGSTALDGFLQRLKERKLVQWALAYVAAAFALVQVLDVVSHQFGWPEFIARGGTLALGCGFFLVLVLAWYHGERGSQRVAGTELLIVALLLTIGGGLLWRLAPTAPATDSVAAPPLRHAAGAEQGSIAVLPFANLSADKESDYFSEGVRDMILTKLAAIGSLKVISRTSSDQFGSHPGDLRNIAAQLRVRSVLQGSVQKSGDQVLINLQLIDAESDHHLWADAYRRASADLFSVEGEIAQAVADALNSKLSKAERDVISDKATDNARALDLFLRAEHVRYEAESGKPGASVGSAITLYEQAVAADPEFALAHARLAMIRAGNYWYDNFASESPVQTAELARQNAERAFALQPQLAEANLAMGYYRYYVLTDFTGALASFQAALQRKPNDSATLLAKGLIERRLSHIEEALLDFEAAYRIDPNNLQVLDSVVATQAMLRRYSAAAKTCTDALQRDPGNGRASWYLAFQKILQHDDIAGALTTLNPSDRLTRAKLLHWQKRYREAIEIVESIPDDSGEFGELPKGAVLGILYLETGRKSEALPLLKVAREQIRVQPSQVPASHPVSYSNRLNEAYLDAAIGDVDTALETTRHVLELQAVQERVDYLNSINAIESAARVYARAHRADLAVPLLEKLLTMPGTGWATAYARLRLDADYEPIRTDPLFRVLLQSYPGSGDVGN